MKRMIACLSVMAAICLFCGGDAEGRGFGGFRAGGFSGGGFRTESFGGGGYRGFDASGSRSVSGYSGFRGGYGATSSYDRSFSDARGGSVNVSGERGVAGGPFGGAAAGGTRDVTATTAGGRTYSGSRSGGAAVGPYGRVVGGGERSGTATGLRGTASHASSMAFAGARFPGDFGLAHYSSFSAAGVGHSTAYWSHSAVMSRATFVRSGFGYYNCFHPDWYRRHPGCWYPAAWAAAAAWQAATWSSLAALYSIPAAPIDYNYGDTVVYQNNNVYVNGQDTGTAQQYAQQATTLADQGQKADPAPKQEWTPLGVFALVQGEEKTSNNLFQLAVNAQGILRGNYYDGLMDTTSQVYGSVDKKTQRAAWTIGKKNDRVFEAGMYNLTKSETPVLVHIGTDRSQQWLLVRVEQPRDSK
jgi:hypothetical protein